MKTLLFIGILLLSTFLTVDMRGQVNSKTTRIDLRGKVITYNKCYPKANISYPVTGIDVYLHPVGLNGDSNVIKVITDSNGFYFFYGIAPGIYIIKVKDKSIEIKVYQSPTQDLSIISI